jgi:hypothetical protein
MADSVEALVFEWVLTNGSLPGFADRVNTTKHLWPETPEPHLIVWRGHGRVKSGIPQLARPDSLRSDVHPVIGTSRVKESAADFGGEDCCLYQIVVKPGVRYLDVEHLFREDNEDRDVKLAEYMKKELIPEDRKGFITKTIPTKKLIIEFKRRIAKEHEILLEGGGIFTDLVPVSDSMPKEFHTSYQMKAGGRRRGSSTRRLGSSTRRRRTRTRRTAKTIRMEKDDYLREHHHLFRVLRNPTRRALNAELQKQQKELKERGLKG